MAETGNQRDLTKGEKTKYRLAQSMKECIKTTTVENITVKQITEKCGYQTDFLPEFSWTNMT